MKASVNSFTSHGNPELTHVLASLYGARGRHDARRARRRDPDPVNAPLILGLTALAQGLFFAIIAMIGS